MHPFQGPSIILFIFDINFLLVRFNSVLYLIIRFGLYIILCFFCVACLLIMLREVVFCYFLFSESELGYSDEWSIDRT